MVRNVVFRENTYSMGKYGGNRSIVVSTPAGSPGFAPAQCVGFVAAVAALCVLGNYSTI